MWNPLPLNLLKFSKKMATKAAISLAASSVVLCILVRMVHLRTGNAHTPQFRHIPHMKTRRQSAGQRRKCSRSNSTIQDEIEVRPSPALCRDLITFYQRKGWAVNVDATEFHKKSKR